jgi:hypothetical protein
VVLGRGKKKRKYEKRMKLQHKNHKTITEKGGILTNLLSFLPVT